jgi:class 3 adenylate cyclase/tetratricopeptide (TPR) repeat protein
MDFYAVLDQAVALLRQRGRVTYRALKLQFQLDDDQLEALKDELLYTSPQVVDDAGRGLRWTGTPEAVPPPAAASAPAQDRTPLAYTPPHLAEQILTSRAALEGERKQVTVLFADLKGSMELLAERDPEEARHLLDPVLDRMMAAVHQYEGTVNQVMGDGIMALFGAPLAHEDHAVRACYAALRMQEAVKQYAAEVQRRHGVPLHMRVGLNAGEVVVRSIGSDLHMDYSAVGQTTHLAARMEQMAMPGAILITPAVLGLVEGFVQVKALGAMPVRGLRDPVEVYEVTGAGMVRSRLQAAAARGLTRFVGRQPEMEALQQALAQAQAGHGQVVAMVGEAGVGKSRLLYEFGHWRDCVSAGRSSSHHTQGWLGLESASVSYGKATPYFPVVDLLKRYCHVEERDDPRTMRAKVTGQILTLDEALQETIPAVLALLDALPADSPFLSLDPSQRRQRTLDGLKRLLIRESQVQPLLLVFEDLHWIDTETQALLDSLVESLPTAQLLLLVNYRPEYQHGWGSKTYYRQLRLDPLPPASADELLQALLGDDPSLGPLMPLLITRTGGNPFFLEESVRTLAETGMLVGVSGAYRLAQPLASLQMPATVQAVLAARIDRLPPEEKHLLQTAAVIGPEVPLPLLQAIAELPEADLHRGLAHLQAAEFLYETRLFPERAFTFKHALTHEVAYGSLLQDRRRVLHTRIVEALEVLSSDRVAEQVDHLAHHAFRGELWDKALAYGRQAGARAATRSAHREAIAYFEQALVALGQLPERRDTLEQAIDVRFDLHSALMQLNEQARILDHLRVAESLAERLGDDHRLARVTFYLGIYFSAMGEYDRAMAANQRALVLATSSGAFDVQVAAQTFLGQVYYSGGSFRQGLDAARQAMALLTGEQCYANFGMVSLPAIASRCYVVHCVIELGDFAEGRGVFEEAMQIAQAVGQPFSIAAALCTTGMLSRRQGDLHRAIPVLERSLALYQSANILRLFPMAASVLGAAYALAGRAAEAHPLLDQVLERVAPGKRVIFQAFVLTELSEALLLVGRVDEASTIANRLLELSHTHIELGYQAHAYWLLGEVAMRHDPPDIDQATAHYRQALTLAEDFGMRPLQAHCHLGLGTLYAQTGQRQQAHIALSAAIDLYRTMDMTFWLPQAETALAEAEGQP